MDALTAGLVAAAMVSLIVMFFVKVRRIEREVDFALLTQCADPDDRLALTARFIANSIVSAP